MRIKFLVTMKLKRYFLIILALVGMFSFAGCSQSISAGPSPTPDPCSGENLKIEVEKVTQLTRSFNDVATLASNTPREKLNTPISELQRIRRDAEDQRVPTCLDTLKRTQVAHMNAVIQTLIAFVGGADKESINRGITLSRQLNNQYLVEVARLLGVTLAPMPTQPPFLP